MLRSVTLFTALLVAFVSASFAQETFVGSFAEPRDGGNLDTLRSTFDGATVVIVPRSHASEAISGATRWRNILFAIRGVQGRSPVFRLPLTSPGTGRMILSGDLVSYQNVKMVWSYEPDAVKWNTFDRYTRSGTSASSWKIEGRNDAAFTQDVVYVSINERVPVADFYEWLEAEVLTHPLVKPTPSEVTAGTFMIGYQSGAPANAACSRPIPDMPLYGFVIRDPAAHPTKLVMLVSGQHPYEGQTKVALQSAVEWILKSDSAEARAYRSRYVTVVYPFVNPTGEMAGLWRGTAYAPSRDTNRNWDTLETIPSRNRGIDTVIVHKNAMKKDIAMLGLGEPYAAFDYHQNFGDKAGLPDYVLHCSSSTTSTVVARQVASTEFAPFFSRLSELSSIGQIASDLTTQDTLRGYMISRGVRLPLTFERSVYNTIASEAAFGRSTVQALVDPAEAAAQPAPVEQPPATEAPAEDPVTTTPPPATAEPAPEVEAPAPEPETDVVVTEPVPAPVENTLIVADTFSSGVNLGRRQPDGTAPAGSLWLVQSGVFTINTAGAATTNTSGRAVIEAFAADVVATTIVRTGSNPTGLVLRASDGSNYLRFMITPTGWSLQKTAAGSTSTLASGKMSLATGAEHQLTASLAGSTIDLSVNGTPVGQFAVPFNQTATRHGLLSNGSGVREWLSFELCSRTVP